MGYNYRKQIGVGGALHIINNLKQKLNKYDLLCCIVIYLSNGYEINERFYLK